MDGRSSCIKPVEISSTNCLTTMAKAPDNESNSLPSVKTGYVRNASGLDNDKSSPEKKFSVTGSVKCELCSCEMSSDVVLTAHINGSRHKKRMKALEIVAQLKAAGEKGVELGPENSPNAYRCEVCSLTVNSPQQLEIHLSGAKHRNRAEKLLMSPSDSINANKYQESVIQDRVPYCPPPPKKKKRTEKIFSCNICDITLNSEMQYEQHALSKKHMNRARGLTHYQNRADKLDIRTSFVKGYLCLSKTYKRKLSYN